MPPDARVVEQQRLSYLSLRKSNAESVKRKSISQTLNSCDYLRSSKNATIV
jgi:hypothetical protein